MNEKIIALMRDPSFGAKLKAVQSEEEMVSLFRENGIDATADQLTAFFREAAEAAEGAGAADASGREELSIDDLGVVAGGFDLDDAVSWAIKALNWYQNPLSFATTLSVKAVDLIDAGSGIAKNIHFGSKKR